MNAFLLKNIITYVNAVYQRLYENSILMVAFTGKSAPETKFDFNKDSTDLLKGRCFFIPK